MNAIDDGWENLLISPYKPLAPRSQIFMAMLSRDEPLIIGGRGKRETRRGDGITLNYPKKRTSERPYFRTVIGYNKAKVRFAVCAN